MKTPVSHNASPRLSLREGRRRMSLLEVIVALALFVSAALAFGSSFASDVALNAASAEEAEVGAALRTEIGRLRALEQEGYQGLTGLDAVLRRCLVESAISLNHRSLRGLVGQVVVRADLGAGASELSADAKGLNAEDATGRALAFDPVRGTYDVDAIQIELRLEVRSRDGTTTRVERLLLVRKGASTS